MATKSASEPISQLFPNGGWDTHHHIYEPARFPYSPERHLTPPAATLEQFLAFRRRLGLSHSVLTHSLSYGDDCASLRAFLPALNPGSAPRGVGVIDPRAASDAELRALHDAGVRGVRIDLYRRGAMEDAGRQRRAIAEHAARLERLGLGWSLALTTTRAELWAELAPFVAATATAARGGGTRLVTDHFALLRAASMLPPPYRDDPARQPGFAAVLGLVRDGHLWVKLSAPYRVSEDGPGYADVEFLVRAFFDANRHRVVWGSDWPHTPRMRLRSREEALEETPFLEVDDLAWLNSLRSWLSDEEWHLLMVENPKALFSC